MLKNITLSAEKSLIQNARDVAAAKHTTLNNQFRLWLKEYTSQQKGENDYLNLMQSMEYAASNSKYSRDELNER